MANFESSVKVIPYSQERVYNKLSDLSNLEAIKDRLPQDKVEQLQRLKTNHTVAFVGDGINDAPVLASADLGISMGLGSEIANNSFLPVDMAVTDDDFVSLDASQLALPRKSDGSLPYVEFLRLKTNSKLYNAGMGCFLTGGGEETSYDWLEDAAILVEGDVAKIVGHGAEAFVYFYINGKAVSFSDKQVDLSAYKGEIDLKATTDNGDVTKLKQIR